MSSASTRGTSVLPAATARRPAAFSIAAASMVVVVLPSVPVMARIGRAPPGRPCSHWYASSISLRTGTPWRRAAAITSCVSGTPGDGDTRSQSATSASSVAGVVSNSTPSSSASARLASSIWSSTTTTSCPRRARARTVDAPVTASPYTRERTITPPRSV
jgi:hypothetical protein